MVEVLDPGFYSSIQDKGRLGYQSFGIPISGCMDSYSADNANKILGNKLSDSLMEITMLGPTLKFRINTKISLTGSDMTPFLNDKTISMNSVINISAGDVLKFKRPNQGLRSYIGVLNGFKTKKVLNSRSMFKNITEDFRLKKGDIIPIIEKVNFKNQDNNLIFNNSDISLKCIKGPEFKLLSKLNIDLMKSTFFTISKNSNRMACQLNEKVSNNIPPILSSHVMPGTVQLTPNGTLIILMRDCQTTGGYPRILQLNESSINFISQSRLSSKIKFSDF